MSSFSSSDLSSCRLRRNGNLIAVLPARAKGNSSFGLINVNVPSTLLTRGRNKPPRSNSWADILRTGVAAPELALLVMAPPPDCCCWLAPPEGDAKSVDDSPPQPPPGTECDNNQSSTIGRDAFLQSTKEEKMSSPTRPIDLLLLLLPLLLLGFVLPRRQFIYCQVNFHSNVNADLRSLRKNRLHT